jgi:hypothetical protein
MMQAGAPSFVGRACVGQTVSASAWVALKHCSNSLTMPLDTFFVSPNVLTSRLRDSN